MTKISKSCDSRQVLGGECLKLGGGNWLQSWQCRAEWESRETFVIFRNLNNKNDYRAKTQEISSLREWGSAIADRGDRRKYKIEPTKTAKPLILTA
ncbi:MAG: hypothetical protein D6680_20720 [Cyanobacteria bacterium J007]|nr:MAG: hypothetical protein D6680_20720 [Cyanobacteria bacterium J007]